MSCRSWSAVASLALVGCASPPPPAPSPTTAPVETIEVLDGALRVRPPSRGTLEPNAPDSIMAAAPAASMRSELRFSGRGYDAMAVFYRDLVPCRDDPEAAARTRAEAWAEKDGGYTLQPREAARVPTFAYRPTRVPFHDDVSVPIFGLVCTPAGLVDVNLMVQGDTNAADADLLALLDSLEPGSRPADLTARTVTLPACGHPAATLSLPAGFFHWIEEGADFEVVRIRWVADGSRDAALALYTGDTPKRFAPTTATDETLEDRKGRSLLRARWRDEDGERFETMEIPAIGCVTHAWASASDEAALASLWELLR